MTAAGPDRSDDAGAHIARIRAAQELMWSGLPETTRGQQRTLSLPEIVEAAIAVADDSGVDGLSMRSIARRLDVGTMSLYRYVPDKGTLLDLVLDRLSVPTEAWERPDLPGEGPTWRRALALVAHEGRSMYLTHPWLLQVNWSRPTFGPQTIASLDVVMRRLTGLDATDRERINLVTAVDGYVVGSVRAQLMYQSASAETGLSDDAYWEMQVPILENAMESGHYPALATLEEDAFFAGWDEAFELGLTALLDGAAARFAPTDA